MQQGVGNRAAFCVALLVFIATAHGQETGGKDAIDTVTIIGHPSDVADIPGSAHVIDKEALEVFNDTDILRVLRTVPGVYVQEEEGFGLRPNIGIRGSGLDRSARIALLEDGILIAPAPYSAPSAYYFPVQRRMNALEILKGPASIVVGPRTTGGAVNMVSTPIPDGLGANADLRIGEHNTLDLHANAGNRGQRVSWLLETVQSQSEGFKHIDGPVGGDTGFDVEDYVAKLQIDSRPGAQIHQSLRLKTGFTDQASDETYLGLNDADFAADPLMRYAASAGDVFESEHFQYQLNYSIDTGANWRGDVAAYRNNFERSWYKLQSVNGVGMSSVLDDPVVYADELGYLKGTTSPDDAIVKRANNRSYNSQGVQAQIDWDLDFGDTEVALTVGIRVHRDEEDRFQHENGYRMEDGALARTTAGAPGSRTNRVSDAAVRSYFVNTEIRAGKWILTPGLRYEDVDLRRLDFSTADPQRDLGPISVSKSSIATAIPGFGALYRLNDEWRVLAGIHKGFNPPAPGSSAEEESSLNIEFGTRFDNDLLDFEAIYFINDYDNLVGTVTESTGGGGEVGDQFDAGAVTVAGLELSASYNLNAGSLTLPLSFHYTWTNEFKFQGAFASNFAPWGDVDAGDELPYIPEHQLRMAAGIVHDRWGINVAANYLSGLRTVAGQGSFDPAESIDSRVVWDLMASWKFTPKLSTYVKVDNLFDATYVAARRPAGLRPGLPRTAYLGLSYHL